MIDTYDADQSDLHYFLSDIQQYPVGCSQEEERDLAKRIQQGDTTARDYLVHCNLRLVVSIAKKWKFRPPLTLLDIIQVGSIGLIEAAGKFDPSKGRFTTYAIWWVRQAIGRAYPELMRAIRLPVHYAEEVLKAQRIIDDLRGTLGIEEPEPEDIAPLLYPDLTPEKALQKTHQALFWCRSVLSLDQNERDDEHDPLTLADDLENTVFPTQEDYVEREYTHELVRRARSVLTPRQRKLIDLYYGEGEENLKKCAVEHMGLSRERGRQIYEEAMDRMRHSQYRWLTPTLS